MPLIVNRRIARIPHLAAFLAGHEGAVVGWGRKRSGRIAQVAARLLRRPCLLLEDGFLRSVAHDGPLLSLLIDDLGAYYDATRASRMERTIAAGTTHAEAARAAALRAAWVASGLSKYNSAPEYAGPLPARYVLVTDQCFGDLSLGWGRATAASFTAMLQAALAEHTDAQILVKVHPEVLAGRRQGCLAQAALSHPRITVIGDACHPLRLIDHADAAYAVTSLIGFEALLRGKPVRCFGMPFYAGWGLTRDALPPPPRRHPARLEDLVHAAFIALARYVDPATGALCTPEAAIAKAAAARAAWLAAHPA